MKYMYVLSSNACVNYAFDEERLTADSRQQIRGFGSLDLVPEFADTQRLNALSGTDLGFVELFLALRGVRGHHVGRYMCRSGIMQRGNLLMLHE